jgi:hypothetical protein
MGKQEEPQKGTKKSSRKKAQKAQRRTFLHLLSFMLFVPFCG